MASEGNLRSVTDQIFGDLYVCDWKCRMCDANRSSGWVAIGLERLWTNHDCGRIGFLPLWGVVETTRGPESLQRSVALRRLKRSFHADRTARRMAPGPGVCGSDSGFHQHQCWPGILFPDGRGLFGCQCLSDAFDSGRCVVFQRLLVAIYQEAEYASSGRYGHWLAQDASSLYLIGGNNDSGPQYEILRCQKSNGSWGWTASMNNPPPAAFAPVIESVTNMSCLRLGVLGIHPVAVREWSRMGSVSTTIGEVWQFDLTTLVWKRLADIPPIAHTAAVLMPTSDQSLPSDLYYSVD